MVCCLPIRRDWQLCARRSVMSMTSFGAFALWGVQPIRARCFLLPSAMIDAAGLRVSADLYPSPQLASSAAPNGKRHCIPALIHILLYITIAPAGQWWAQGGSSARRRLPGGLCRVTCAGTVDTVSALAVDHSGAPCSIFSHSPGLPPGAQKGGVAAKSRRTIVVSLFLLVAAVEKRRLFGRQHLSNLWWWRA